MKKIQVFELSHTVYINEIRIAVTLTALHLFDSYFNYEHTESVSAMSHFVKEISTKCLA